MKSPDVSAYCVPSSWIVFVLDLMQWWTIYTFEWSREFYIFVVFNLVIVCVILGTWSK